MWMSPILSYLLTIRTSAIREQCPTDVTVE